MDTDELLQFLVNKAETTGAGTSVSLCVNGLVVAGDMVSSKIYFNLMSKVFDKKQHKNINAMQSQIKKWADFEREYKEFITKASKSQHNSEFIHLKNAVIFSSSIVLPPYGINLWRGRISSIDAFSIGKAQWKLRELENNR